MPGWMHGGQDARQTAHSGRQVLSIAARGCGTKAHEHFIDATAVTPAFTSELLGKQLVSVLRTEPGAGPFGQKLSSRNLPWEHSEDGG